ncbi:MAG: murein biosynthesis integral membrane protein MurJ [Deltaproteobacteria bacterium]|nr:murein biosynthesis integral membrane protein MurJ [Deltaproteobacteria bacterium]
MAAVEAEHESSHSEPETRSPGQDPIPGERRPKDRIAHAAGLVGLLTLGSRVLGLLRDAVVAASFRKTATDAFIVAFTIPNVLRRLLAEGSLTVAFMAVFTDYRENKGEEASRELLANTLTALSIVLIVTTAAGMIFARPLVLLFAKGMTSAQLAEATLLTRLMFPFLITVGFVALAMGALNTVRHFAAPAAAPMILNVLIIATILGASDMMGTVFGLPRIGSWAMGVLLGGVGQLLLQLSPLARRRLLVFPRLSLGHAGLRRVGRLMLPSLFGLAIYQINIVLARRFASYLAVGSISYLYYAQRLIEFPIGIFAVAVATVSLPKLSGHASAGEFEAVKDTYRYALRLVLFVMLPATAGLLALGEPLAAVLFQRGAFDYEMARQTAWTLSGFSLGLVAAGGVRQTAPVFFALEDTRTPVFASALSLSVYIVSALALYERYATFGLALAVALGSSANFAFLLVFLRRRLGPLGLSRIMGSLVRSAFGAVLAGGAAVGAARLGVWHLGGAAARNYAVLALAVLAGSGTYVLSGLLLGSPEIRELRAALRRRRGRS